MSDPVRIAFLAPLLASQLRSQTHHHADLHVAWAGEELSRLLQEVGAIRPTVIVADLDKLGDDPKETARAILSASGAELIIVAYTFGRREDLRRLEGEKVRIVRAPLTVESLKLAMMSVLVRKILKKPEEVVPVSIDRDAVTVVPPRFDPAQLGKLQEIQSAIQCECPNHVATTLVTLRGFEDYSRTCIDRDPQDAEVHRMLYRRTAAARVMMEDALVELLRHENIIL